MRVPQIKLGISTYALTWSIGVPGYTPPKNPISAVDFLKQANYSGVNLVQIADNMPLHLMSEMELEVIRKTAEECRIEIEIGTRGTNPDHLLNYLGIAKRLQAKFLRTLITEADITKAEEEIRQVLPQFINAEVVIGIENHGLHKTKQLIQLFDNINSSNLGCCLDTVNSFGALEAPDKVIEDLIPYIVNLHIKDFDIQRIDHQMGFQVLGTPAGSGRLDMNEVILKLNKAKKTPTAILELWTPYSSSVEETIQKEQTWFKQSLDYLQKLL